MSYIGNIKSWFPEKGYGFIECPETQSQYGKDMFFQKSEVERLGGWVNKGDEVQFDVREQQKGVIAYDLVILSSNGGSDGFNQNGPDYHGTVKSFHRDNGYGFIECPDTFGQYGKDIIVLKSELRGNVPIGGEQVTFCIRQGEKGPVATNIRIQQSGHQSMFGFRAPGTAIVQHQMAPGMFGFQPPGSQNFPSMGSGVKRKFDEAGGPRYAGVIKSYNPTKGWGFIECDQTFSQYGKDIFVMKSEFVNGTAETGQQVMFSVAQGKNGPNAVNVEMRSSTTKDKKKRLLMEMMKMMVAKDDDIDMGMLHSLKAQMQSVSGAGPSTPPPDPQTKFIGLIKNFDEEKGYGFVTSDAIREKYGKDIFISKATLNGEAAMNGDQVTFTVKMGTKGPVAATLTIMPEGSFETEARAGTTYRGEVKSWNEEKGWGFVTSGESNAIFGKDVFLRRATLGEHPSPSVGDPVSFTVRIGKGDKAEVASVTLGGM